MDVLFKSSENPLWSVYIRWHGVHMRTSSGLTVRSRMFDETASGVRKTSVRCQTSDKTESEITALEKGALTDASLTIPHTVCNNNVFSHVIIKPLTM